MGPDIDFVDGVAAPDAEALLRSFVAKATGQVGFPLNRLSSIIVLPIRPNQAPGHTTRVRQGRGSTFSIEIDSAVCFVVYRLEKHGFPPSDEIDALRLYVVYHELGHCMDGLRRFEFLDSGFRFQDQYQFSRCSRHHVPICLSEYAASRLSAKFMSNLALNKAIRDFKTTLGQARMTPQEALDVRTQAFAMWRVMIEYCKLAAIFHGNGFETKAFEHISDAAITEACGPRDHYLSKLWAQYPNWNGDSKELQDGWVELGEAVGAMF
jgi:hypothetical protein